MRIERIGLYPVNCPHKTLINTIPAASSDRRCLMPRFSLSALMAHSAVHSPPLIFRLADQPL
jgi:hypothetical protein